ncbi:hypothetical protein N7519_006775 [Penicillium mononematosum]|uniref:uncharacterized protein n=1 Tax=Penicillium mononematosum TaxID=268346 RepID=UPI0025477214|nr:uncharacterized protein N7519_006775 [Penicillium mononematosum]KAJ6185474.1 hypothetical protein N7519_006775 [Penicillium mononematosum]
MNGGRDERPRWLIVDSCYGDGEHGGPREAQWTVMTGDLLKWMVDLTSLPIVLKPKPATVRLEVVD